MTRFPDPASLSVVRPPWSRVLWAGILYTGCTLLFFYPLFARFTTALIGPPEDNMQDLWNTWYSQVALASDPQLLFRTRMLYFPEGSTLVYHSFAYPNVAAIFLLRALFGLSLDPGVLVGLHNLMLLLAFPLAALGAFVLTWQFTKQFPTALVGGYLFAFSPFHFAQTLHHMGVATIQFIPWFVLCVWGYLNRGTLAAYLSAVLLFALSALASWYCLFYNAYFIALYYGYYAFKRRAWWLKDTAWRLLAILAGAAAVLSPWIVPMAIQGVGNPHAYRGGHDLFVADLVGFALFHPYHLLSGVTQPINARLQGNPWEMSVYLGLINLALLAWGVRHRKTMPRALAFALIGMAFFMLMAAGRSLHVLGHSVPGLYLPTALTEHLPFFGNVRTPSRAIVYVYLFLGVAIGCILKALCFDPGARRYRWQRHAGTRRALAAVLALGIFLDYYSIVRETTPVACPPAYDLIRRDTERPAAVLDLPTTYLTGNRAMMAQIFHQHPIVHASISRKLAPSLIDNLAFDDLDLQQRQLREAGVRYIVLHKRMPPGRRRLDQVAYARRYRTVHEDGDHAVFRTD